MVKWLDDISELEADVKAHFAERGETPNPTKAGMYVKLGVFYNIVISLQEIRNEIKRGNDKMEEQNEMIKRIHKLE